MATEIERTWIVDGRGWRDRARPHSTRIVQGYLHVGDHGAIRARLLDDDEAVLTVKRGSGRVRHEIEVAIDRAGARELVEEMALGDPIRKRRHLVDLDTGSDQPELVAEVDVFEGALDGLVLVDVELPAPDTPVPDVPWFGREVTGEPGWSNAQLSLHGRPDR